MFIHQAINSEVGLSALLTHGQTQRPQIFLHRCRYPAIPRDGAASVRVAAGGDARHRRAGRLPWRGAVRAQHPQHAAHRFRCAFPARGAAAPRRQRAAFHRRAHPHPGG